jgi:hypothetical protein
MSNFISDLINGRRKFNGWECPSCGLESMYSLHQGAHIQPITDSKDWTAQAYSLVKCDSCSEFFIEFSKAQRFKRILDE